MEEEEEEEEETEEEEEDEIKGGWLTIADNILYWRSDNQYASNTKKVDPGSV